MADGADLIIDPELLRREGDGLVRRYLTAGTLAVGGATKRLERQLEEATRIAVPGRLWRAWASDAYPRKGPARNPTGTVFVNGGRRSRGAIAFWTQPGSIRGREGQFLAIPLPAAGPLGRVRELTPGEWERAHGVRLRFVFRPGRASLLVADAGVLNGRTGAFRPVTRARTAADVRRGFVRGEATIPIFVLVPTVPFRNAVPVDLFVRQAGADLTADFLARTR